jgi:hypothetical protein
VPSDPDGVPGSHVQELDCHSSSVCGKSGFAEVEILRVNSQRQRFGNDQRCTGSDAYTVVTGHEAANRIDNFKPWDFEVKNAWGDDGQYFGIVFISSTCPAGTYSLLKFKRLPSGS